MDKRFFVFILASVVILFGYSAVLRFFFPPPERPAEVVEKEEKDKKDKKDGAASEPKNGKKGEPKKNGSDAPKKVEDPAPVEPVEDPPNEPTVASQFPAQRVMLGSLDPTSEYRMLVTFSSRGAAIERIELNNPRYSDFDDLTGYMGHLALSNAKGGGCQVGIVGPGTPAAAAGLQADDVITSAGDAPIRTAKDLVERLDQSRPRDAIELTVMRGDKQLQMTATLVRRPLEVVRPELGTRPISIPMPGAEDQLSLLFALERVGDKKLLPLEDELDDGTLRDENWEIVKATENEVVFQRELPSLQLRVLKRYGIAKATADYQEDDDYPAYNLTLDIEIQNLGEAREVAYRLDGPTGMPTEGWWFSNKIGRSWGGRRLRDVALHTQIGGAQLFDSSAIVDEGEEGRQRKPLEKQQGQQNLLAYIGAETQYFAAILIPQNETDQQRYASWEGIRVGNVPDNAAKRHLTNVTSRLISKPRLIETGEANALKHSYVFFAGPKRPVLLSEYGPPKFPTEVNLRELIYFGWPIWGWFARPLSGALHIFYALVRNYGIAIIMLTVVVRLCMFPLSRKQALNAQKMQELQPEMKRLAEKYKSDMEKRSRALQDLYKKHSYNPLAGCMPLFIQLPIFIGLYRALMVDVELRQAPLIPGLHWCSNLAAPDMLWRWEGMLPVLITETGFLGPYLNILPLITVALFIWQQKMFMPPPTDDQAAMQQKIMQYMMIFFGFLFFKVPSGLCIYFIASSLWGVGERKLLPKKHEAPASADAKSKSAETAKQPVRSASNGSGGGNSGKRKKKQKR